MKEIKAEITLHSTLSNSWSILTDFGNYPNWNPYIKSVKGAYGKGEKLKIIMQLNERRLFYSYPRIILLEEEKEMEWRSHLYLKGIFDVSYHFSLMKISEEKVLAGYKESYSGAFAKSILKNTKRDQETAIQMMLKALKKRVREI